MIYVYHQEHVVFVNIQRCFGTKSHKVQSLRSKCNLIQISNSRFHSKWLCSIWMRKMDVSMENCLSFSTTQTKLSGSKLMNCASNVNIHSIWRFSQLNRSMNTFQLKSNFASYWQSKVGSDNNLPDSRWLIAYVQ